jgi:murein tripeptide amidase MpaA
MKYEKLVTLAEQSNFRETGRIEEVERLSAEMARTWPEAVQSFEYGRSVQGRPMRALVVSRTGARTAGEIRARKIPVLMLQGGIHPGESDGKDAGFIALRELLEGSAADGVLGKVAILFVPAFNTDGHERTGRWNRPNQVGPQETGWRTTAQNLNLNRDYTKADAPEMRAMLRLIDTWDPLVCADLHVTDGADFQPDISIQVEPINQGDLSLRASAVSLRDQLIARLAELGSMPLDFYPDLAKTDDPSSGFALTVYSPRFSTGYFPQRNRYTVLVETHSWKEYAHRVKVTRNTIVTLAELVAAQGAEWLQLCQEADALGLGGSDLTLDYVTRWREPSRAGSATHERDDSDARMIDFPGYAYTRTESAISGGLVTTYDPKTPQVWRVPMREAPGAGYVVPVSFAAEIGSRLEAHGVEFVTVARGMTGVRAGVFRAQQVLFSAAPFEGRMRAQLDGAWSDEVVTIEAGALFVPIARRLARLVAALFEPRAPDSFAAWGFFNACFEQKEQMEPYVAEQVAAGMLAADSALKAEFMAKVKADPQFAASPSDRLEFFLRRHVSWDARYNLYPVMRVDTQL